MKNKILEKIVETLKNNDFKTFVQILKDNNFNINKYLMDEEAIKDIADHQDLDVVKYLSENEEFIAKGIIEIYLEQFGLTAENDRMDIIQHLYEEYKNSIAIAHGK